MKFWKKTVTVAGITALTAIGLMTNCFAETTGIVNTETVRMRKEPNTSSGIVTLLSEDFKVSIIEKQGDWYKVKYKDYTGYVSSQFIKTNEKIEDVNETQEKKEDTNEQIQEEENTQDTEEEKKNVYKKVASKEDIYLLPLINSKIIGQIEDEEVYVIQNVNGWSYVSTDNIIGWIRTDKIDTNHVEVAKKEENKEENSNSSEIKETEKDKDKKKEEENIPETTIEEEKEPIKQEEKIGYINSESVNFRKKPNKSSEVIDTLKINTKVTIISEENGWVKVEIDSKTGYVAETLISDEKVEEKVSSRSQEKEREIQVQEDQIDEEENEDSDIQKQIVDYAKTFLGCDYIYGGSTPAGFDCSGFVQYVYKHFGYSVSRSSSAQAKDGKEVSKKELELGDIVIFLAYDDYSRVGHVGIYIGNNEFIHANDEKTGVIITSLSKGKYPERFVCGRRIV